MFKGRQGHTPTPPGDGHIMPFEAKTMTKEAIKTRDFTSLQRLAEERPEVGRRIGQRLCDLGWDWTPYAHAKDSERRTSWPMRDPVDRLAISEPVETWRSDAPTPLVLWVSVAAQAQGIEGALQVYLGS